MRTIQAIIDLRIVLYYNIFTHISTHTVVYNTLLTITDYRKKEITRDHVQVILNWDGQQRMEEVSRLVFRETSGVTKLCMSCSSGHGSQWRARVSDRARRWWVCPGSTSGSSFDWMKRLQRILRLWWTWTEVEKISVWNILSNVAPPPLSQ